MGTMANSSTNTLQVPGPATKNPATLFKAAQKPMRVVVTNVGGSTLFLAHDTESLTNQPVLTGTYVLPAASGAGSQAVIVLAPMQGLYAVTLGAGGVATIAVSEALPVT